MRSRPWIGLSSESRDHATAKGVSNGETMEELARICRAGAAISDSAETPEVLIGYPLGPLDSGRLVGGVENTASRGAALWNSGCVALAKQHRRQAGAGPWGGTRQGQGPVCRAFDAYFKSLGLPSLFEEC